MYITLRALRSVRSSLPERAFFPLIITGFNHHPPREETQREVSIPFVLRIADRDKTLEEFQKGGSDA